jgi:hypothetical protein
MKEKKQGHILTKVNAADILAQYFRAQFKIQGGFIESKKQLLRSLGLVSKRDFEKMEEELDRLQGMLTDLQRSKTNNG